MADSARPTQSASASRTAALRKQLHEAGLTGFIIPHADENQSEYLPPSAERLAWLTGFTGSAGTAIVLADKAAVFADGRYTLQVRNEIDPGVYDVEHLVENPPSKWLSGKLKAGDRIGHDPWLMTVAEVARLSEVCSAAGAELVAVGENPIDKLWADRPPAPLAPVTIHPLALAGEEAQTKITGVQATLAEKKADATVLAEADSIAWLFNIRGSDIAHNPVALAFAIVPAEGKPDLFIDARKLTNSVRAKLAEFVEPRAPQELVGALAELGSRKARVLIDPQHTPAALAEGITKSGGTIVKGADPVALPRARKNKIEVAGSHAAHVRDGAAMVRFLAWLDREAPKGAVDEISAAEKLRAFRIETSLRDGSELVDLSFATISGAGPNGAIIHYRVTPATALKLEEGSLYLVDSGAQYRDGTTDITRTIAIGTPTDEMRDRFTRVLKGHIAIATARFPAGVSGAQLDSFARAALWQAGLDYDHGTGHGVGSFLSVHEGPARISKLGTVPLEPGMILSNEPGYYKAGEYGIRIENLILVLPPVKVAGGERDILSFETLTLAPIDRALIEPKLLTGEEIVWLDAYHASLPAKLSRLLDEDERRWLARAVRPLSE
jgi:Xaa-Pro aminopeptidase